MRLLSILFVLFFGLQAAAQERLALVIGNSNYEAGGYLKQPVNDAQIMADALKEIGFKVTLKTDLDDGDLKRAIRDHRDALYAAGDNAISFFYYAGHGANDSEDDYGGTNYMIPIGAKMDTVRDLSIEAVELSDAIKSFSRAGISFVVFDACRNFPFSSSLTRSSVRGFTVQPETKGTFIAFSSEPGRTALDNSGFSLALAGALKTPGLDHRDVFTTVRTKVYQQTSQKQFSWFRDGILGDVIFKKGAAPKPIIRTKTDDEIAWEFATRVNSKGAYEVYISTFPNGKFVQIAQGKIKSDIKDPEPSIIPVWSKITDEYWSTLGADELVKFVLADTTVEKLKAAADKGDADAASIYAKYFTSPDYHKTFDYESAMKYNQIAHDGGNLRGTHSLGYSYSRGLSVPVDTQKAKQYYELGCQGGIALSCNNLAVELKKAKDFSGAVKLYQRACNLGAATACGNLALEYAQGNPGLAKDFNKAFELADQACLPADEYACFAIGDLYLNGWGVEKSPLLAEAYYAKSCNKYNPTACRQLGRMNLNGDGIPKDEAKAFELIKKACDHNDISACNSLGNMYRKGIHVATDFDKAMESYQDSCDKESPFGCYLVGLMEYNGEGRPVNYSRSRDYLAEACELKQAKACNKIGYMNGKGLGGSTDGSTALKYYISACELKLAIGCSNAGLQFEYGRNGTPRSPSIAADYYMKAVKIDKSERQLKSLHRSAVALRKQNKFDQKYLEVLELGCRNGHMNSCNDAAWQYATTSRVSMQNGTYAVELAEIAVNSTSSDNKYYLSTLAAAYARVGRYSDAIRMQEKAIAASHNDPAYAERLRLYQQGRPYTAN